MLHSALAVGRFGDFSTIALRALSRNYIARQKAYSHVKHFSSSAPMSMLKLSISVEYHTFLTGVWGIAGW